MKGKIIQEICRDFDNLEKLRNIKKIELLQKLKDKVSEEYIEKSIFSKKELEQLLSISHRLERAINSVEKDRERIEQDCITRLNRVDEQARLLNLMYYEVGRRIKEYL